MITIFGVTFYTLWAATFLFAVTGLIYLVFILIYFARRYEGQFGFKIVGKFLIISFSGLAILFTIFHWDIILTGIYVDRLCKKEGGLHVYETVEAKGFLASGCPTQWLEYGYTYCEELHYKKKFRYTLENGQKKKRGVNKFKSQFVLDGEDSYLLNFFDRSRLRKVRNFVRDVKTNNILGELIYFTVDQGWADSFIAIGFNPWMCCNTLEINGKKIEFSSRTDLRIFRFKHTF